MESKAFDFFFGKTLLGVVIKLFGDEVCWLSQLSCPYHWRWWDLGYLLKPFLFYCSKHYFTNSSLNPTILKLTPTHFLMLDLKFEFASNFTVISIFSSMKTTWVVTNVKKHQIIRINFYSRCWTFYLHLSFLLWQVRNFTSDYWMERLREVMVVFFAGKLVIDLLYILILLFIIHAIIHSFVAA